MLVLEAVERPPADGNKDLKELDKDVEWAVFETVGQLGSMVVRSQGIVRHRHEEGWIALLNKIIGQELLIREIESEKGIERPLGSYTKKRKKPKEAAPEAEGGSEGDEVGAGKAETPSS